MSHRVDATGTDNVDDHRCNIGNSIYCQAQSQPGPDGEAGEAGDYTEVNEWETQQDASCIGQHVCIWEEL